MYYVCALIVSRLMKRKHNTSEQHQYASAYDHQISIWQSVVLVIRSTFHATAPDRVWDLKLTPRPQTASRQPGCAAVSQRTHTAPAGSRRSWANRIDASISVRVVHGSDPGAASHSNRKGRICPRKTNGAMEHGSMRERNVCTMESEYSTVYKGIINPGRDSLKSPAAYLN